MMYIKEICPCGTEIVLEGVYEKQACKTLNEFREHHTGCLNKPADPCFPPSITEEPIWWPDTKFDNKTESH